MNLATASTPAPAALKPAAAVVPAKKKKSKVKWFVIGGVVLVVVLAAAAKFSGKGKEQATSVTVEKAFIKTITQLVTATGKVQPEIEVKISPEVAGEIIALPVKDGNVVKKGDLLVRIKPDYYQAQFEQEEANLSAAKTVAIQNQAQLQKAVDDFKRAEDLYAKNLISDSDYAASRTLLDVAKATHENSLAQIRRTEGSLNQARDLVAKTTLYAPMDGTISSLSSEAGERVVAQSQFTGTEIMRIADLSNMELRVKVNENDIVNVKIGDRSVITIDAYPGRKFTGIVKEISSSAANAGATGSGSTAQSNTTVSDEVTNFLVKIRISDREMQLRPGMSATADIETQTVEKVVAVPIQSVTVRAEGGQTSEEVQQQHAKEAQEKSGNALEVKNEREDAKRNRDKLQRVVFIKRGDTVKMEKVETGIADNSHIEVKSGVKSGDEVVSGSYAAISRKLKDGTKVQLEKPKKEEEKK
jgi:HlyD family secretion protein